MGKVWVCGFLPPQTRTKVLADASYGGRVWESWIKRNVHGLDRGTSTLGEHGMEVTPKKEGQGVNKHLTPTAGKAINTASTRDFLIHVNVIFATTVVLLSVFAQRPSYPPSTRC